MLKILDKEYSIMELNLSSANLSDRCIDEMAQRLKGKDLSLRRLNISNNKFSVRGLGSLLQCFQSNMNGTIFKLESLIVDRNDLSKENSAFNKLLVSCLKMSRLKQLSFASCKLDPTTVEAMGEGMKINRLLEHLCLRDNFIGIDALPPFLEACLTNAGMKL